MWHSASVTDRGFTLIELLIVIGLLGALAALVLSSWNVSRTEIIDDSIVQTELADIQCAFQRFKADCAPNQADYRLITLYGLEILMRCEARGWSFPDSWDAARNKGWRGPYLEQESLRIVDATVNDANSLGLSTKAQGLDSGGTEIAVIETPYRNEADYYRVLPELSDTGAITELWVVAKSSQTAVDAGLTALAAMNNIGADITVYQGVLDTYLDSNPSKRRLLLE